jgi:CheY-like chemotaxis protein
MSENSRPRVLVVDDEGLIADTLTLLLSGNGYVATAAYDGGSALEQARSLKPDLIISDVMMPGMNGVELAIQVRQFLPSCKVLLFSGQVTTARMLQDIAAQGYSFEILEKPVPMEDLLSKLKSL